MNCLRSFALLSSCLVSVVACSPTMNSGSDEAMIVGADALDADFVAAFNGGDVEAMNALYWNNPDVVVFPPDAMQARGFAAVAEANRSMLAAMPGATLELTEHHQMLAGNVVIGWGLWQISMPGPQGTPTQLRGRYSDVKGERDGKWVYLVDHASVPLPAEP